MIKVNNIDAANCFLGTKKIEAWVSSPRLERLAQIKKGGADGTEHHIICEGWRRHVLWWDTNGTHCSEPKCEVNSRDDNASKV